MTMFGYRMLGMGSGVSGEDPLAELLARAEFHFEEDSIIGSTPVSAMNNYSTAQGGSAYNYDLQVGPAPERLTRTSRNGLDCVVATGATTGNEVGLETTSGKVILGKTTEFMVCSVNQSTSSVVLTDAKDNAAQRRLILMTATEWLINNGSSLNSGVGAEDRFSIIIAHFNQDSTSSVEVVGLGTAIGDCGSNPYQFGTLFNNLVVTAKVDLLTICAYIGFLGELTNEEDALMENYLLRWNPTV